LRVQAWPWRIRLPPAETRRLAYLWKNLAAAVALAFCCWSLGAIIGVEKAAGGFANVHRYSSKMLCTCKVLCVAVLTFTEHVTDNYTPPRAHQLIQTLF
jgi:hypothetical protein